MKILIVTPGNHNAKNGNWITAMRWRSLFRELGHRVLIQNVTNYRASWNPDFLIALHANHSADAVEYWHQHGIPSVVCLTGTDIHLDLEAKRGVTAKKRAKKSLDLATQIVVLEPTNRKKLKGQWFKKSVVIRQSARQLKRKPKPLSNSFEVTVIGHLRPIKDPFLVEQAVKLLPESSRIRITHIGRATSRSFESRAKSKTASNFRYRWVGAKTHGETLRILARSRATVLTSKAEGAPNVISEAIVNGVPLLSTKIDAAVGLLGQRYPGLFPVGDAETLAKLLDRFESSSTFRKRLQQAIAGLKPDFSPTRERQNLKELIQRVS